MSVTQTIRDISALTPAAQTACNLFMESCRQKGLNVLITETYRSQERQDYLYEQGRSRPGKIVTWTKNSRHTSGRAWDVCKNVKGEEYSDASFFKSCGDVAAQLGIIWGGTWSTPDTPHFEISTNWKEPEKGVNEEMTDAEKKEFEELKATVETQAGEIEYYKGVIDSLADRITKLENPFVYNYIDVNMPEWARPTIQKLVDKGLLVGDGNGELGLVQDDLRHFVINDRAGLYD